jgi:N-acetylglucosaminyl-diphospho-decaprenol L-rhamnosyltransferase
LRLSIIVVSWNTKVFLMDCLASIWQYMPSVPFEVFVVDNGSSDGTAVAVHEVFPWVKVMANKENRGFATANNQAIRHCAGQYILLLNSDAVLPEGGLETLLRFADAHPRAGIVGVKLTDPDGSFQASCNDFPTLCTSLLEAWGIVQLIKGRHAYPSYTPSRSETERACDWVGGACLLARSEAVRQVGLLDEGFFMNSEEVDWCFRMRQAGWQVWYTPSVEVRHWGGASAPRRSGPQRQAVWEGKLRFLDKHRGGKSARIAAANLRAASAFRALCHGACFLFSRNPAQCAQAQSYWHLARATR